MTGGNDAVFDCIPVSPHGETEELTRNAQSAYRMAHERAIKRGVCTTFLMSTPAPLFPEQLPWKSMQKACNNAVTAQYAIAVLELVSQLQSDTQTHIEGWDEAKQGTLCGVTNVEPVNLWDAIVTSAAESYRKYDHAEGFTQ